MRVRTILLRCAPAALAVLLTCACACAAEEAPPAPQQSAPLHAAGPAATAPENPSEPAPLPAVARFRIAGNDHFSSRSIKRGLETPTGKPIVAKTLLADVDRIVARYADDGYLEAQVKATFEPVEGKAEQELLFTITEGRRFTLKKLEIVGNTVFSTEELRALVKPEVDGYFSKGGFLEGARRIWAHYGEAGRLTTVVEPQMGPRPAASEAEVRYVIREGPPVTLQAYSFQWTNTPITAEWLVLREADRALTEGEPLKLAQIEEVVGRLKQYRWFKSVEYKIQIGDAPDRVRLVFLLEEGWTTGIHLTGTAATYFGFSGALEFKESNFDLAGALPSWQDIREGHLLPRGRGEQLVLSASPGQRLTTVGGSFSQPYTFGTDNHLVVGGQYSREELSDYRLWQWQVRPGLMRELSEHWSAGFGPAVQGTEMWNLSRNDVPDFNDATGYTPGYGAWGQLAYATTTPGPIVNRGVRAGLTVTPMYEDAAIVRSTLSASRFFPLHGEGLHAHVLEVAGNAGYLAGNAPVFDRFYCGGLGSVRGFGVQGISPQFNDTPIGGYFLATATAEYGFPLFHVYDEAFFRGALFVDAGDAETRLGDMSRIRVASGFGLRVVLPKIRGVTAGVNFAWPLNSYPGDDTQVFTIFITAGL